MLLLLSLACRPDEEPPPRPAFVADEVVLHDESTWSEPVTDLDQHHATVAVLPDGRTVLGWTDGSLVRPDETSWLRRISPHGLPLDLLPLDAARGAGKPDVIAMPDGRALVGYQSDDGLFLARFNLEAGTEEEVHLAPVDLANGNASVDLALRADGTTFAVWYDQDPPLGTYRAAAFDPDLLPVTVLPLVVAETEDVTASTPDVDLDASGRASVAWVDQRSTAVPDELHCTLLVDGYDSDGALAWRVELAAGVGEDTPRRPTTVSFPDGSLAVGWRVRAATPLVPVRGVVAFLGPDGATLREPFVPVDGDTDDLVLARVTDDALWLVWTAIDDPELGVGTITGGLLSFPGGESIVEPMALSASSSASRPHTDANLLSDRGWRVAVSWEELDALGIRSVHGRTATVR